MIKDIIKRILELFPTRNIIVFESIPNLSDNTKPVFDEMMKRNLNDKYKFVWLVSGKASNFPKIKNVFYLNKEDSFFKYKLFYYRMFAKALISCNDFLATLRQGQVSFYISHGTALKSVRSYYNIPKNVDYLLVDGEKTKEAMAYEFNGDIEKTVALGYPRNDVLVNSKRDITDLFPENRNDKKIVWYPTFRQHKNSTLNLNATDNSLPLLHDENQAEKLNNIAKENSVLIILKPHFAQDVSKIKAKKLSNIKFINDEFYLKNNITSYEFIANCDALITDYSSVYYDFLLCDKPIGLVWEDYEEYKKNVNFAVDMDYNMKAGEKIYNLEDFEIFIKNLALNNDNFKKERKEISKWANFANDGKSAKRVVDFITEKANL